MGFLWQVWAGLQTSGCFLPEVLLVEGFYMDNVAGDPEIYGLWFSISFNAQSPNLPAYKELQISDLSAREGSLFCFGEFPGAVRQSLIVLRT
jgi:hypothetical protein